MRAAGVAAAALLLAACTTFAPAKDPQTTSRADALGATRTRAAALEREGQLRPALLEWRIARAIDPADADARANETRLVARIDELVTAKIADAKGALGRRAPLQARRALLAALALDPANATAGELRASVRGNDYPVNLSENTIRLTLEEMFRRELLEKDPADGFRFKIDLLRLWIRRSHSIWQVVKEVRTL